MNIFIKHILLEIYIFLKSISSFVEWMRVLYNCKKILNESTTNVNSHKKIKIHTHTCSHTAILIDVSCTQSPTNPWWNSFQSTLQVCRGGGSGCCPAPTVMGLQSPPSPPFLTPFLTQFRCGLVIWALLLLSQGTSIPEKYMLSHLNILWGNICINMGFFYNSSAALSSCTI